jgi:hypothetical protein
VSSLFLRNLIGAGKGQTRWAEVLADVKADIAHLEKLVPIIERKIERGEPWPGESATQN